MQTYLNIICNYIAYGKPKSSIGVLFMNSISSEEWHRAIKARIDKELFKKDVIID
jgi:hypothetical protein